MFATSTSVPPKPAPIVAALEQLIQTIFDMIPPNGRTNKKTQKDIKCFDLFKLNKAFLGYEPGTFPTDDTVNKHKIRYSMHTLFLVYEALVLVRESKILENWPKDGGIGFVLTYGTKNLRKMIKIRNFMRSVDESWLPYIVDDQTRVLGLALKNFFSTAIGINLSPFATTKFKEKLAVLQYRIDYRELYEKVKVIETNTLVLWENTLPNLRGSEEGAAPEKETVENDIKKLIQESKTLSESIEKRAKLDDSKDIFTELSDRLNENTGLLQTLALKLSVLKNSKPQPISPTSTEDTTENELVGIREGAGVNEERKGEDMHDSSSHLRFSLSSSTDSSVRISLLKIARRGSVAISVTTGKSQSDTKSLSVDDLPAQASEEDKGFLTDLMTEIREFQEDSELEEVDEASNSSPPTPGEYSDDEEEEKGNDEHRETKATTPRASSKAQPLLAPQIIAGVVKGVMETPWEEILMSFNILQASVASLPAVLDEDSLTDDLGLLGMALPNDLEQLRQIERNAAALVKLANSVIAKDSLRSFLVFRIAVNLKIDQICQQQNEQTLNERIQKMLLFKGRLHDEIEVALRKSDVVTYLSFDDWEKSHTAFVAEYYGKLKKPVPTCDKTTKQKLYNDYKKEAIKMHEEKHPEFTPLRNKYELVHRLCRDLQNSGISIETRLKNDDAMLEQHRELLSGVTRSHALLSFIGGKKDKQSPDPITDPESFVSNMMSKKAISHEGSSLERRMLG